MNTYQNERISGYPYYLKRITKVSKISLVFAMNEPSILSILVVIQYQTLLEISIKFILVDIFLQYMTNLHNYDADIMMHNIFMP